MLFVIFFDWLIGVHESVTVAAAHQHPLLRATVPLRRLRRILPHQGPPAEAQEISDSLQQGPPCWIT